MDDVAEEPAKHRTVNGKARALQLCSSATACSHAAASFVQTYEDTNGLVLAAVLAFKGHHSLQLTPDAIFNTIMGGVSAHVNADPEKFRSCFVSHDGKENLKVRDDSLSLAWSSCWERPVAELGELVLENLPNTNARNVLSTKFSTTGPQEAAAHTMTFMDVVKECFDYGMMTMCGIPFIDVSGCKEDWETLAAAVDPFLNQLGLGDWNMQLQKILSHFIAAFDPEARTGYSGTESSSIMARVGQAARQPSQGGLQSCSHTLRVASAQLSQSLEPPQHRCLLLVTIWDLDMRTALRRTMQQQRH